MTNQIQLSKGITMATPMSNLSLSEDQLQALNDIETLVTKLQASPFSSDRPNRKFIQKLLSLFDFRSAEEKQKEKELNDKFIEIVAEDAKLQKTLTPLVNNYRLYNKCIANETGATADLVSEISTALIMAKKEINQRFMNNFDSRITLLQAKQKKIAESKRWLNGAAGVSGLGTAGLILSQTLVVAGVMTAPPVGVFLALLIVFIPSYASLIGIIIPSFSVLSEKRKECKTALSQEKEIHHNLEQSLIKINEPCSEQVEPIKGNSEAPSAVTSASRQNHKESNTDASSKNGATSYKQQQRSSGNPLYFRAPDCSASPNEDDTAETHFSFNNSLGKK